MMMMTPPKSRMFSFENCKGMRTMTMDIMKQSMNESRFRVFSG